MTTARRNFALKTLMTTTALSGALMASAPAHADDECGVPVGGVVTCTASGSPYQAIRYTATGDLTVQLDDDVLATGVVIGGGGDKTVFGGPGSGITAAAKDSTGLDMRSADGGALNLTLDTVSASGESADGLWLETGGDVSVDLKTVTATGFMAHGGIIRSGGHASVQIERVNASAWNGSGFAIGAKTAEVNIDEVVIDAANSNGVGLNAQESGRLNINSIVMNDGIYGAWGVTLAGGNVALDVGTISGSHGGGVHANANGVSVTARSIDVEHWGIHAQSSTDLNIDVGRITTTTTGTNSAAAIIAYGKHVDIVVEEISTLGSGWALYAGGYDYGEGDNTIRVKSGQISTQGTEATGIFIDGRVGAVVSAAVDSGSVTTAGEDAFGIHIQEVGEAVVASQSVATSGAGAIGVSAHDVESLTVLSGTVVTSGQEAAGLKVTGSDKVVIESETVETTGDGAPGIEVDSALQASIKSGTVRTGGANSAGIKVGGVDDLVLDSGSIVTSGERAYGLQVTDGGDARLKADAVTTSGYDADGVVVYEVDGVVLDLGDVVTTGDQSAGVTVEDAASLTGRIDSIRTIGEEAAGLAFSGTDIDLEFGSVETLGAYAIGIEASSDDGFVRLKGDSVVTHGRDARGVVLDSPLGAALELGSVLTHGAGSDGLVASIDLSGGALAPAARPELSLKVGDVRTEGLAAIGVNLFSNGGATTGEIGAIATAGDRAFGLYVRQMGDALSVLKMGTVTTHGEEAIGISLTQEGGELEVSAGTVTTSGDYSAGAWLDIYDGSARLAFDSVVTGGTAADGIVVAGPAGDIRVGANRVTTTGEDARGVVLGAGGATRMTVELGSVATTGDFATAVTTSLNGLSGDSDALILKAGALTTSGYNADGLYLYADDLTLDVDTITTAGDSSTGAFLNAYGGHDDAVTLSGRIGAVETAGENAAGVIIQSYGLFDLTIGSIHTRGAEATGLRADSSADVGGKLALGSVLTEGEDAQGVTLETELGGYDVTIQSLETRGDGSVGIDLTSGADTKLALGAVRTFGSAAAAVKSRVHGGGELSLAAENVRTSGAGSAGIDVFAEGDLTLALGAVEATGSEADAVRAASSSDVKVTVARRLGSTSGVAADLEGGSIDVTLASTAVVEGHAAGLLLASDSSSVIRNAGAISSANGFAIEAEAGRVTLDNSGLITGRVAFAGEQDVVNNSGRFAAAATSNFGGGEDVFNNTGVLMLADANATTPRTAFFNNLERLTNAGTIDLGNGVAGDVFTVSGILNGQTSNSVVLDLDLRGDTPQADRIVAGGFEGLSHIVLNLQGDPSLKEATVVIAQSQMAQTGGEMEVIVAGGGFIGYEVAFADGAYQLSSKLALPGFEPTKVATGAQHQWTSGADVVSARFEQMRDEGGRPEGRGNQAWAQVFGGSNDIEARRSFDVFAETVDADLSHEVKSQGVQAGVDRAVRIDSGALVVGMLAGAGKTELRFQNGDVTEYDGIGIGAYGHWFSGPMSIGVMAKVDTFKLDYDWAEANLKTRSDGYTRGVRVDAAWRFGAGQGWYVEPQASLSWSDTTLGWMTARDGTKVVFGDTTSLVGRIGVRAGADMALSDRLSFKPFAAVHVLNEAEGENASKLVLADEVVGVTDRGHGAWGRAVLGASLDAASGVGGFVQVESDFGDVEGFTARAGVKISW